MTLDRMSHRRRNPLTNEWVLVSPHRTKRPWQGQEEPSPPEGLPEYDPDCYLCPGNGRAGGARNPDYEGVYVFDNDFAALLARDPDQGADVGDVRDEDELLVARPETGVCRVICYSPRHDLSLCRMDRERIACVVAAWREQYADLGARRDINHVQIFENRGASMGCSNPHPHGQIWAQQTVPDLPAREGAEQEAFSRRRGACLLCRYLERELALGERLVLANDSFVALIPFWAVWPFEVLLLPRRHAGSLASLGAKEGADLADAMLRLGVRYDNLFCTPFPYSMGIHQQPTDGLERPFWHWHMHYYPPLLRSRSVRKFMVGYEMLATAQRDITPEQGAERLRAQPEDHYQDKGRDS